MSGETAASNYQQAKDVLEYVDTVSKAMREQMGEGHMVPVLNVIQFHVGMMASAYLAQTLATLAVVDELRAMRGGGHVG